MQSSVTTFRPLDHLVLPTADLEIARSRLTALGFTVAPVGVHPFGTANCCVHFANGTFLEPLAVADRAAAEAAIAAGNVFVARDREYRSRQGEEGFSALVLATQDAAADNRDFRASGLSAGDMLAFSRLFATADGALDTASFLLAFAADPEAPYAFFFTCERVRVPKVNRAALTRHANGAAGIREVVLSASEPARFRAFLEAVFGAAARESASGLFWKTENGDVVLLDPSALRTSFGISAGEDLGLLAITFDVADLTAADTLFSRNGVTRRRLADKIIVPPAAGQGATFAFEAMNR